MLAICKYVNTFSKFLVYDEKVLYPIFKIYIYHTILISKNIDTNFKLKLIFSSPLIMEILQIEFLKRFANEFQNFTNK